MTLFNQSASELTTVNGNISDMLADGTFCSARWDDMWITYKQHVHSPLRTFICIVGCVTNVVNLFIFTRSEMQNPTNLLLSVLAAIDFLCVFRKAVDLLWKFQRQGRSKNEGSNVEDWINEICFYLFHTWSIYMTLAVALWRLVGILRPVQSRYWLSYKKAALVAAIFIGFATLLVPLVFAASTVEQYYMKRDDKRPAYDGHQLKRDENCGNESGVVVDDPNNVLTQTDFGGKWQLWILISLLIKLIPCLVLLVCTILLVMSLKVAAKNRLSLFEDQNTANNNPRGDEIYEFGDHTTLRTATCRTSTIVS